MIKVMRNIFIRVAGILILLFISLPALADEVSVSAYLNSTSIQLGETVTLTVEVAGAINAEAPDVEIPDCRVQYYGPSSQISIVNGRRTEQVKHLFAVTPQKEGTIGIPAIEVKAKGKTYQTQPFQLTVGGQGHTVQGSTGNGQLDDYVFLEMVLPRTRFYVNEEIPLTIKFYAHSDLSLDNIQYPVVKIDNFIVQSFPEPERRREYRDGQYFTMFPFQTTIRPLSPGVYEIKDIKLNTDVLIPQRGYSFFDNYQRYNVNLTTEAMTVEVLDFPKVGKPADFKGAVGNYKLDVEVSPTTIKVGEPVTIRMRITGTGSFNTVTAPTLAKDPRFKYYDVQMVQDASAGSNEKIFEQVVIPTEPVNTLPEVSFSFFNPTTEKYMTLRPELAPLEVSNVSGRESQVVDYRDQKGAQEVLGQGILYIKPDPGHFVSTGAATALASSGIFGYNLVVLLALAGGVLWKVKQGRETPAERKRKELDAYTEQALGECGELLKVGQNAEFYTKIYGVVQNYLKEHYQIAITGISDYETQQLQKAGVSLELLGKIREFYRVIDEKRFAGYFGSAVDMEEMLRKAREIIAEVREREVV